MLAGVGVAVSVGIVVHGGVRLAREELTFGSRLDAAVEAAGGETAIRSCGQIATTPFERQALAYRLELPPADVWTHAERPGIALIRDGREAPGADALPVVARVDDWTIRRYCSESDRPMSEVLYYAIPFFVLLLVAECVVVPAPARRGPRLRRLRPARLRARR